MKNILLPTDFSSNSVNAIQYAVKLLKKEYCTFYLLHAYRVQYLANDELLLNNMEQVTLIEQKLLTSSQNSLEMIVDKIEVNSKHTFKLLSDFNFFIDSVKQKINEFDIDLIIMGTKGATGAKEIFMGSNTGDVIMKTDCDVLAVPDKAKYKTPKEIIFPTDFRLIYREGELDILKKIADQNDSIIRVLHVQNDEILDEEQKVNKKDLERYFDTLNYSFHTLTNTDFESAVNCFTQSRGNVDMIAIIAKHYNIFQRLFFKPKVEDLSFHTKVPLLVLHKNK
jgi:nucleotide-binding universal stress UspA family protein